MKDVHPCEDPVINHLAKLHSVSAINWTPAKHVMSITVDAYRQNRLARHVNQVRQALTNFQDQQHWLTNWQITTIDLIPADHWWYPKQSAKLTLTIKLTNPRLDTQYYQRDLTYFKR